MNNYIRDWDGIKVDLSEGNGVEFEHLRVVPHTGLWRWIVEFETVM
jgi:hypothetical protein